MKRSFIHLLVIFSLCFVVAKADEATKLTKIEELFQITKVDQMQTKMIEQYKTVGFDQLMKQMNLPADRSAEAQDLFNMMLDLMSKKMSWERMKPSYVKLYDDTFTEDELQGMLDFYKSPAGKATLEKMPILMTKSVAMAQEMLGELLPEFSRLAKEYGEKQRQKQPPPLNKN